MVDLVRLDELRAMLKVYGLDVVIDYDPEAMGGQFRTIRTRLAEFDRYEKGTHPFTIARKSKDENGRNINQYFNLNTMEQVESFMRLAIKMKTEERCGA